MIFWGAIGIGFAIGVMICLMAWQSVADIDV